MIKFQSGKKINTLSVYYENVSVKNKSSIHCFGRIRYTEYKFISKRKRFLRIIKAYFYVLETRYSQNLIGLLFVKSEHRNAEDKTGMNEEQNNFLIYVTVLQFNTLLI